MYLTRHIVRLVILTSRLLTASPLVLICFRLFLCFSYRNARRRNARRRNATIRSLLGATSIHHFLQTLRVSNELT